MKRKFVITFLSLVLALCLVLTGCGGTGTETSTETSTEISAETGSSEASEAEQSAVEEAAANEASATEESAETSGETSDAATTEESTEASAETSADTAGDDSVSDDSVTDESGATDDSEVAEDSTVVSAELLEQANAALAVLDETKKEEKTDEAVLEAFQMLQSSYNYDENNERFFVDPTTAANLPGNFAEVAQGLGEYEYGLAEAGDWGCFLIMRLPLSDDELSAAANDWISDQFNNELQVKADNAEVVETEAMSLITSDFLNAYFANVTDLQTNMMNAYAEAYETTTDSAALEEATLAVVPEEALADCVAYLTGDQITSDTVLMTVDGREIPADFFFYFLNYEKLNNYGTEEVSETVQAILLTLAKQDVYVYASAYNLAQENGVTLNEEEQATLDSIEEDTLESSMLYMGTNKAALVKIMEYSLYGNAYVAAAYGEGGEKEITEEQLNAYIEENGYFSCLYCWFYESLIG